eukprot:6147660-Amphidinium_carterae.1
MPCHRADTIGPPGADLVTFAEQWSLDEVLLLKPTQTQMRCLKPIFVTQLLLQSRCCLQLSG